MYLHCQLNLRQPIHHHLSYTLCHHLRHILHHKIQPILHHPLNRHLHHPLHHYDHYHHHHHHRLHRQRSPKHNRVNYLLIKALSLRILSAPPPHCIALTSEPNNQVKQISTQQLENKKKTIKNKRKSTTLLHSK